MIRAALLLLAGAAVTVAMVGVSPASAGKIKPGVGIAGVKLGFTERQVIDRLGKPDGTGETDTGVHHLYYGNEPIRQWLDVRVTNDTNVVVSVSTRNRHHVTPEGIRVGMGARKVRHRLQGETCRRYACVVRPTPGARVYTLFSIFEKRLDSITVGLGDPF